ncbi:MAG: glycosyltransferase family 4 protein [Chloroflexi bacterium]|nr:glycosyltransferase family 4 protein [Chloroflexota bacterium]
MHLIYDDIGNPWVGGGGATRTIEIYSRIAQRGHSVRVVCGNYPGAPTRQKRYGVNYRHVGYARSYVLSRLTYMLGAVRLIKGGGYDIVIEDVSPFSPIGAPLWNRHVPSVASVQNLSGVHATAKYGMIGLGPKLVEKPLISLFKNFVAVSPGIADELRQILKDNIRARVIPNSAGTVFQTEGETSNPYGRYILSLGRIDIYQKGLDRLIATFEEVAQQVPDLRLLIAGSGVEEQVHLLGSLVSKSHAGERIELLGQVSSDEAAKLMKSALALVLPSRYEAWPLSAIEAGAAGTPVVGFDIVGVRDAAPPFPKAHGLLVGTGDTGDTGDTAAMSEALVRIATDAALRTEVGRKGQEWASRFTWDALAEEQLSFYEELVSK